MEPENLRQAYRQVKANDGAAGVDGMTVETFAGHARAHWPVIAAKLKDGSYQPGAVRGVGIPKPNGGERRLGIPTGQDRLIQQAVAQVPTPMFDPQFSAHSDGYRPGRSAQEAVRAAQEHIRGGHTWIVEVDIGAFFDEMDQDIPMRQVSAKVNDKRVLRLLGDSLRSPVQLDGRMEKTHASNTPGRTPESAVSQHLSG